MTQAFGVTEPPSTDCIKPLDIANVNFHQWNPQEMEISMNSIINIDEGASDWSQTGTAQ